MADDQVVGQRSGLVFREADIFNNSKYASMKSEVLIRGTDTLVVPVRNKAKPHFRTLSAGLCRERVGQEDTDPTHKKVVTLLLDFLVKNSLVVTTKVFLEGDDKPSELQVLFDDSQKRYSWVSEADARVPVGGGRFIQPDIAGWNPKMFHANARSPSVIIEVIRTHPPDTETFNHLLRLSEVGYLVLFYFIAPDGKDSKYNSIRVGSTVAIQCAHYLCGGSFFKNANRWDRSTRSDEEWYHYLRTAVFETVQSRVQEEGPDWAQKRRRM